MITRLLAAAVLLTLSPASFAQRGQRAGGTPPTAKASAPVDLTGYWVSVVSEDWRWRMVTPPKGDVISIPVNAEGQKIKRQDGTPIANTEDPAVAADVAERLNDDEARREEDKWSA